MFDAALEEAVLGLYGGQRVHGVGAGDGGGRGLAQADVADLAGGDQLGHGPDALLDRDVRVDAVQVVQVDVVRTEVAQRAVGRAADVLGGPVVAAQRTSSVNSTPVFVAITAASRRPASALPRSCSFRKGP